MEDNFCVETKTIGLIYGWCVTFLCTVVLGAYAMQVAKNVWILTIMGKYVNK